MENINNELSEEQLKKLKKEYTNYINKMQNIQSSLKKIDVKKGLDNKSALNIQGKIDSILSKMTSSINIASNHLSKYNATVPRVSDVERENALKTALGIDGYNSNYDLDGDGKNSLKDVKNL